MDIASMVRAMHSRSETFMRAFGFLSRTLTNAIVLLAGVLVFNFLLVHLAPGDPADVLAGEMGGSTPELMAQIRSDYGLDQPIAIQLATYIGKVATGDLGHSFYYNQPVTKLIFARLGATVLLVVTSLLLAIFVGTLLGVVSARRPNSFFAHAITVISLLGYAAPVFWLAIMLILLFAWLVPIFPLSGMASGSYQGDVLAYAGDVLWHLVLPMVTLSTIYLAFYSRLVRATMLDVLGADYIRTARAKGLNTFLVVYKHALRNAILPVITYAGLQFGHVISGAVLVETVFNWPGLGTLAYDSILRRDSPVLLGILFFSALMVIVVNILTDVVYRIADPRIRAE